MQQFHALVAQQRGAAHRFLGALIVGIHGSVAAAVVDKVHIHRAGAFVAVEPALHELLADVHSLQHPVDVGLRLLAAHADAAEAHDVVLVVAGGHRKLLEDAFHFLCILLVLMGQEDKAEGAAAILFLVGYKGDVLREEF